MWGYKMEIKLKDGLEEGTVGGSDGFWYDLTSGGYFDPDEVMADPEQLAEMRKAIALVERLEEIYNQFCGEN